MRILGVETETCGKVVGTTGRAMGFGVNFGGEVVAVKDDVGFYSVVT